MARNSAIDAVSGEVFKKGWSKIKGAPPTGRKKQMARAVAGYSSAVFKRIRTGGCHSKQQLIRQLEYITSKSDYVVDSRDPLGELTQLGSDDVKKIAGRFTDRWNERFSPKTGNSTHLLMSFPIGTRADHVRDIASEICEDFFEGEFGIFDYIIAVHTDRDHPHAHVVVNRRAATGEYLYFAKDHHFNYDAIKEAMVDVGDRYGVRMHAASRLERGIVEYAPKTKDIYRAKEEGREAVGRARIGKSLEAALIKMEAHSIEYQELSDAFRGGDNIRMADALFDTGRMIAQGGHVVPDGAVYMDSLADPAVLAPQVDAVFEAAFERMAGALPEMRAGIQRDLFDGLKGMVHLKPLGEHSDLLLKPASEDGLYALDADGRSWGDVLSVPEIAARLETVVQDTGLSPSVLWSRLEIGATNAALEQDWVSEDLRAVARNAGFDLSTDDGMEAALDRLDAVHNDFVRALIEMEVVAERLESEPDGLIEGEAIPQIVPGSMVQIFVERVTTNYSVQGLESEHEIEQFWYEVGTLLDDERWDRMHQGDETALDLILDQRLQRLHVVKAIAELSEDAADQELASQLRMDIALERRAINRSNAEPVEVKPVELAEDEVETTPQIVQGGMVHIFLERVRENYSVQALENVQEVEDMRNELSLLLTHDQWHRMFQGDETALDVILDNRLDRLQVVEGMLDTWEGADKNTLHEIQVQIAKTIVEERRARTGWDDDYVL